jgi:hypothetical protein
MWRLHHKKTDHLDFECKKHLDRVIAATHDVRSLRLEIGGRAR